MRGPVGARAGRRGRRGRGRSGATAWCRGGDLARSFGSDCLSLRDKGVGGVGEGYLVGTWSVPSIRTVCRFATKASGAHACRRFAVSNRFPNRGDALQRAGARLRACVSVGTHRWTDEPSARLTGHTGSGPAPRARHASPLSAQTSFRRARAVALAARRTMMSLQSQRVRSGLASRLGLRVPRLRGGFESVLGNGVWTVFPAQAARCTAKGLVARLPVLGGVGSAGCRVTSARTVEHEARAGKTVHHAVATNALKTSAQPWNTQPQARRQTTPYPLRLEGHHRAARRERDCASPAKTCLSREG